MNLVTAEEKNYKETFNTVEFALRTLANRHQFYSPEKEPPHSEQDEMYRSVYLYSSEIIEYFQTHTQGNGKNTTSGYDGEVWIDKLIVDIDDKDLALAHERTKALLSSIKSNYGVDLSHLSVNFSGSKGFHIRIPAILFGGFEPGVSLPVVIKAIALKLTESFEIDRSVYDKSSLMRIQNSMNRKSGLFAIPLTSDELFDLTIEDIKDLAKGKRQIEAFGLDELMPVEALRDLKNTVMEELNRAEGSADAALSTDESAPESDSGNGKQNAEKKEKVDFWEDVEPGNRHEKMVKLIGHLAGHGLSDEDISNIVLAWNKQLTTPKDESQLDKELKNTLKSHGTDKGPFWNIRRNSKNGKIRVMISMADFIGFLEDTGFAKKKLSKSYAFVKITDNKLREIEAYEIKDEVLNYVKHFNSITSKNKKLLLDQLIGYSGMYFGSGKLECIESADADIRRDKKNEAYLYFKNGYVVISKDKGISFQNYADMEGLIWESQIVQRDIQINATDEEKSVFRKFLMNVCRGSNERFNSLRSAIGFLLHEYKDEATAKAVVLIDEKIPVGDEPNGRTGKSIVGKALNFIRKSSRIDGKNFEFDSKFTFQEVYLDTKIVEFNDVKRTFNFENLFSVITDNMSVEYKSKPKYTIPFAESPKFLISTNYTIKGSGSSFTDRLFEIEFSDHYNEDHKPIDDFGHVFFSDEWDSEEWNRFYNFMIGCLHFYLQNGLVSYRKVNLELRKLIDYTKPEFIEFADEEIAPDTEYNKNFLYEKFKSRYPDFYTLQQRKFTDWVKEYAKYKGYEYRERKSNGKDYYTLATKGAAAVKKNKIADPDQDLLFVQ